MYGKHPLIKTSSKKPFQVETAAFAIGVEVVLSQEGKAIEFFNSALLDRTVI